MTQHYRMTLEDAIAHYREGWITSTALLYYYLKIRLKQGWKMTLSQKKITKELGIPKTSLYRAIEKLARKNLITWEAPNGVVVELVPQRGVSSIGGTESSIGGTESSIGGTDTPLKPLLRADSGNSSYYYSNSYQIFLISLSEGERESFENFCREEVASFPKPIVSLKDYLGAPDASGQPRYEDFWQRYVKSAAAKEVRSQQLQQSLTEELYQQWTQEFCEVNGDYLAFAQIARRDTPEWELRVKFCEEWDRRRNADALSVLH